MQKLFYVVCQWLQTQKTKQSDLLCSLIKQQMSSVGFNYQDIRNAQSQRQVLYRQRQKLIKEKNKLQQQKKQIEREREEVRQLRMQELREVQNGCQSNEVPQVVERVHSEEQNAELEQRRQTMMQQYYRLQNERNCILQEREVLFERMEKMERLQKLQKRYQEELKILKEQTEKREENEKEQRKCFEEEEKEMGVYYEHQKMQGVEKQELGVGKDQKTQKQEKQLGKQYKEQYEQ